MGKEILGLILVEKHLNYFWPFYLYFQYVENV